METDALDGVVAGVLSQEVKGKWHPIAFYSKTMLAPKQNYKIHNKEMLVVVWALEKWQAKLEGL
jgi:hypothetical protein